MPDLDKVIQLGITRLCKEYERLAAKENDLSAADVKVLYGLTKTLMDFRNEPAIREMMRAQKIKLEPTTEEMMDIIHGKRSLDDIFGDEDAENEEAGGDDSTGSYS